MQVGANVSLQVNIALVSGVRGKRDIRQLSSERHDGLVLAVRAAAELVARAARGTEVRASGGHAVDAG